MRPEWRSRGSRDDAAKAGRAPCASASCIGLSAELGEQKAAALGQQLQIVDSEMLAAHEIEQHRVDAFEADGTVANDLGHGIGGEKGIGKAKHRETPAGRAVHQVQRRR